MKTTARKYTRKDVLSVVLPLILYFSLLGLTIYFCTLYVSFLSALFGMLVGVVSILLVLGVGRYLSTSFMTIGYPYFGTRWSDLGAGDGRLYRILGFMLSGLWFLCVLSALGLCLYFIPAQSYLLAFLCVLLCGFLEVMSVMKLICIALFRKGSILFEDVDEQLITMIKQKNIDMFGQVYRMEYPIKEEELCDIENHLGSQDTRDLLNHRAMMLGLSMSSCRVLRQVLPLAIYRGQISIVNALIEFYQEFVSLYHNGALRMALRCNQVDIYERLLSIKAVKKELWWIRINGGFSYAVYHALPEQSVSGLNLDLYLRFFWGQDSLETQKEFWLDEAKQRILSLVSNDRLSTMSPEMWKKIVDYCGASKRLVDILGMCPVTIHLWVQRVQDCISILRKHLLPVLPEECWGIICKHLVSPSSTFFKPHAHKIPYTKRDKLATEIWSYMTPSTG